MIAKTLILLIISSLTLSNIVNTSANPSPLTSVLAQTGSESVKSVKQTKEVAVYQCGDRAPLKYKKGGRYLKKKRPALGYSHSEGAQWVALCKNTPKGTVPGRYSKKGKATYEWGHKEHKCKQFSIVYGELVHARSVLPSNCAPRGYQKNDKNYYYNAVFVTKHGMIPGKASENLKNGWYSHQGKYGKVTDGDFYIVC